MLKLIYTDTGIHLEGVTQSLQIWLSERVAFAQSVGEPLWMEASYGSLLLPPEVIADSPLIRGWEWTPVDEEVWEVNLPGIWLAADPESCSGLLVVSLGEDLEQELLDLWQLSYIHQLA
ncbi:MAG: hypothetical protein HC921_09625 [Synechococcaceae cyanobacterium SM2_3_1]|nr:hypothetical protein [Synechococcaceae cyanobacterium SM2_3_1]